MTPAGVQGVDGGLYLIILIFFFSKCIQHGGETHSLLTHLNL